MEPTDKGQPDLDEYFEKHPYHVPDLHYIE